MRSDSDHAPVSVKAALRCGDQWVLLRNERGEWELPGGRIDPADDSLEAVVRRECCEELGVDVEIGALIDAYLFEVVPGKKVTIICFAASVPDLTPFRLSEEHDAVGLFTADELVHEQLADGYRQALMKASECL